MISESLSGHVLSRIHRMQGGFLDTDSTKGGMELPKMIGELGEVWSWDSSSWSRRSTRSIAGRGIRNGTTNSSSIKRNTAFRPTFLLNSLV